MKKRRFLSVLVALLLILSTTMSAMAVEFDDVDSFEKLQTAFDYDGEDAEVIVNLSGDVRFEDKLDAKENKTVTIHGNDNILEDVVLGGSGSVTINADIIASDEGNALGSDDALTTEDAVKVTVNGDIDSETNNGSDGVQAEGASQVTVNGNIKADSDGVIGYDEAAITVNGDVWADDDEGVDANDTSTIIVNGNVVSDEDYGVEAGDESQVTVNGNVTGGSGKVGENGELDYGTMSDPDGYSDGSDGVYAEGSAKVTVTGDVTGGKAYGTYGYSGSAITALDTSTVIVEGNAKAGDVEADPEVQSANGEVSYAGDAIRAESTANVLVSGDVTGGSTNGDGGVAGSGINIYLVGKPGDSEEIPEAGAVVVEGTVTAGENANGDDGYGIIWYKASDESEEAPLPNDQLIIPNVAVYAIKSADSENMFGGDSEGQAENVYYIIKTPENEKGEVVADVLMAKAGETVTVTATPNKNHKLISVFTDEGKLEVADGKATIEVPVGGGVTVQAEFEAVPTNGNPHTGDQAMPMFYALMMLVTLLGICVVVLKKKLKAA